MKLFGVCFWSYSRVSCRPLDWYGQTNWRTKKSLFLTSFSTSRTSRSWGRGCLLTKLGQVKTSFFSSTGNLYHGRPRLFVFTVGWVYPPSGGDSGKHQRLCSVRAQENPANRCSKPSNHHVSAKCYCDCWVSSGLSVCIFHYGIHGHRSIPRAGGTRCSRVDSVLGSVWCLLVGYTDLRRGRYIIVSRV